MNAGAGCHFLLQGTSLLFPSQGLNLRLLRLQHWQVNFYHSHPPPPGKHPRLGSATNGRGSERVSNLPEVIRLGVSGSKHGSPALVQVKLWAGILDSACHVAPGRQEGLGQLGL